MIPLPMPKLAAIVAVAALLAGAAGGWAARAVIADRDVAELQALHAQERQRHADAARAAEAAARETEQRRAAQLEEIERDAQTRTRGLQADAAAARAAADLLRQHVIRLAGGGAAPGDPAAADGSTPATGPGLVLAELFGRADDRAGELAAFADAAHSAGLACERAFDSLRKP